MTFENQQVPAEGSTLDDTTQQFQGGPSADLNQEAPVPQQEAQPTPPPAVTVPPVATQPPRQIAIGDKIFNTEAEAIAYANGLEQQRGIQQQIAQTQANAAARPDPADLLFEDPKAALRMVRDEILQEQDQRAAHQRAVQNLWDGFYAANPDLKGNEEVLEFIKQKHWNQVKDLPTAQSLPFLASQTRAFLAKSRGDAVPSQELPSKPAVVAGASGQTPPAQQVQRSKPTTFVDELKAARQRKSS